MHSPACETWDIHSRRSQVETFGLIWHLEDLVDYTLHTWEQELLLNDPEFEEDFHRLLVDVMDEQAEESVA